jgi:hypothetical protein
LPDFSKNEVLEPTKYRKALGTGKAIAQNQVIFTVAAMLSHYSMCAPRWRFSASRALRANKGLREALRSNRAVEEEEGGGGG